ncbi:unnamed protein product [Mytilus coruscus]|uniref:Ig-like domain-containing protein n=1 Tax=Mytilus coruscus TaxID=42192 RepID=A0A6J8ERJ9_MYTCO|nr:unnamed protein product [Mytilus coruscus]
MSDSDASGSLIYVISFYFSFFQCSINNTLVLLLLFAGANNIDGRTYFITPGSHLQLDTSIPDESISCYFFSERINSEEIEIISSGKHDTRKYQVIPTKTEPRYYQAPQEQLSMQITYREQFGWIKADCSLTSFRDADCKEIRSSTMYLRFRFAVQLFYSSESRYCLSGYEIFTLKIMKVSTKDRGRYTCIANHRIWIKPTRLRFLNRAKDNIIYGQEGVSTNISCTSVTGFDAGELSIQQNDTILATSNSNIVTFYSIPKRHDSFTKYRCFGKDSTLEDVHVQVAINYAPDVKVVCRVNSIDCFANGYPKKYIFYEWEHQSEQGKHIRFLEGLQNGTLNLQTLPQQYQIGGKYICSVSNGISGLNGSMIQKGFGSCSYIGPPIFAPENKNKRNRALHEPLTLNFLLYSNPIVENIWIEGNGTLPNVIHDFRISNASLLYTGSVDKGNIAGYDISFETNISTDSNTNVYTIWAENKFGVDFYQFKIVGVEPPQCNTNTRKQFIASCSIVAGLLVYLIVSQVCFYKSVRKKQTMESNIPHDLNIHNYDEIGPIAYQYVNQRPSDTDHQELIQQTSFFHSRQTESATINIRHYISINDSTVESQRISESSDNELHQVFISEVAINTTPGTTDEHTIQCFGISSDQTSASSDEDNVNNMLRSNQSRINKDEHSSSSNRSSTSSSSRDESRIDSNGAALSSVIVSDGYEHPYQIAMQINQDPHAYTCITQTEQIGGAKQSHKTDELQGLSSVQTTALNDVNNVDNTLRLNQRRMYQAEHSLNSNRSSTSSTSSNESRMDSNGATLNRVIVCDGYENPYQIVMQVNQDPDEYTHITQPEQIDDANQSHTTDELKGKIREYDNLRRQ